MDINFNGELFIDAGKRWDLEALYSDIASIKRLELTDWEKTCLRGLLCGYHPKAIASKIYWTASALRTELSRRLYPYISTLVDAERITWNKVSKLLKAGYEYPPLKILKRDLLNLEFISDQIKNRSIIRAAEIINSLKNSNSTRFSKSEADNFHIQGHEKEKQQDFSNAIYFYKEALLRNTSLIAVLFRIARCYDRLKLYKNSFFICDFVLSRIKDNQDKTHSEKRKLKSHIYTFLGGVFHELALENPQRYYITSANYFYNEAQHYSPYNVLPLWNLVDLFISVSKQCLATSEEHNDYLHSARAELHRFKSTASTPESNFRQNQETIIRDAQRVFEGLDEWWEQQLYELKNL